ncbi:hypothetical protein [Streptomyces sp. NPDC094468]|uniref:hypothetical protein n=1 Tax=Streptomyces sp. NPDC094468 TaxID=3366066 RepID=UPI00380606EC
MTMFLQVYQVTVPARLGDGRQGVHVFTGRAGCSAEAVREARRAYDAATAARRAGLPKKVCRPNGWTAMGIRCHWRLTWPDATVRLWRESGLGEY